MTARSVIRLETWTLTPDREPDAKPTTYRMQCAVCEEASAATVDFADSQDWALSHSGRNPSHHTFREVITRPWRTWRHS
ncbi:hypothetical protein G3I78_30045 [Streptomyces sp. SID13726]|nr:hypothetical protein [Streptomyces sp. SID13726]